MNSRRFLAFMVCVFLLPFFVLSAWNHPSLDDFTLAIFHKTYSFWDIQSYFYLHWSGRYVATFIASIFATTGILYTNYEWFAAVILIATLFAWLFTLHQVNRYVLEKKFPGFSIAIFSALLLALELHVIPEIKTQFYWFSGSVTYQVPVIFIILCGGFFARYFYSNQSKISSGIMILLLDFLINGFNELISVFVFVLLTLICCWQIAVRRWNPFLLILWFYNLIWVGVMFLSPGNLERKSYFSSRSIIVSAAAGAVKFFVMNWYFLKEPLWWLMAVAIFNFARTNRYRPKGRFFEWLQQLSIPQLLGWYILFGLLVYMPTLIGSNGSLPPRAENATSFLFGLLLLLFIYIKGTTYSHPLNTAACIFMRYRYLLFSLFLFTTTKTESVVQSLASGYFYHQVFADREKKFRMADGSKEIAVEVDSYDVSIQKKIDSAFPNGLPQTIRWMIQEKPTLLYMSDYLNQESVTSQVYGVKRLIINDKMNSGNK